MVCFLIFQQHDWGCLGSSIVLYVLLLSPLYMRRKVEEKKLLGISTDNTTKAERSRCAVSRTQILSMQAWWGPVICSISLLIILFVSEPPFLLIQWWSEGSGKILFLHKCANWLNCSLSIKLLKGNNGPLMMKDRWLSYHPSSFPLSSMLFIQSSSRLWFSS